MAVRRELSARIQSLKRGGRFVDAGNGFWQRNSLCHGLPDEVAHAAEETTRKAALSIVERWNWERSVLWSPTVRCAITAGTPWLDVQLPPVPDKQGDRHPHTGRHPLASVGSLGLGLAVLVVSGRRSRQPAFAR